MYPIFSNSEYLINLYALFSSTETTLTKVQRSSMMLAYEINAVGPILVIKVICTFLVNFSWNVMILVFSFVALLETMLTFSFSNCYTRSSLFLYLLSTRTSSIIKWSNDCLLQAVLCISCPVFFFALFSYFWFIECVYWHTLSTSSICGHCWRLEEALGLKEM